MKKNNIIIFILGIMSFTVSQVFLRVPILNFLMGTTEFTMFQILHPFLIVVALAFSAGIFEEGFRYIFKKYLLRPARSKISEPIIFGLGHGLAEAVILFAPYIGNTPFSDLRFGLLERVFAIIIHVGLSVVIWNGFQKDKRIIYLILAIVIHGAANLVAPIMIIFITSLLAIEIALAIVALIMIAYVYKSRRLYIKEEKKI